MSLTQALFGMTQLSIGFEIALPGTAAFARKAEIPVSIRLFALDCLDLNLVPLKHGKKYIALTHFWGKKMDDLCAIQPTGDLGSSFPLQLSEIPLTIRDAIQVVQNIGRHYLCVDRYCLAPHNAAQRHEAISNMNQIYAGAELTTVALWVGDDRAGLPGVSSIPRSCSIQEVPIRGGHLIWTLPSLAKLINQSEWSFREWTYQEARLSWRCLFFSKHQLYFSCHEMTMSEALPDEPSTSSVARHLNSVGLQPLTFSEARRNIPNGLFLDRMVYSRRSFTYQRDALDAFRGILRLHPFVTLWGVPVARRGWDWIHA